MKRHRKQKHRQLTLKGLARHRRNRMKRFEDIAHTACAAIVCMRLIRKIAEKNPSVTFPSGGFVPLPDAPKVGVAQMQAGEMVLHRGQIDKLKHAILVEPADSIRTTISAENMSDVLKRIIQ